MQAHAAAAAKHIVANTDPFHDARFAFEALVQRFSSRDALAMTHSELERVLETEGRAVLRQLLQDHLALRAPGDAAEPSVTGTDGVKRTHRREHTRPLLTVVGEVEVVRTGYGQDGVASLHPLDAELNLPVEKYSLGVRARVADLAARQSFDGVVADLTRQTGTSVPKRQVEDLVVRAAQDFDAFYRMREQQGSGEATGPILVISTDAKGVRMRQVDLRQSTRKKAARRHRRLCHRQAPGEKRGQKRMAQVAAVYTIGRFTRRPEDVIGELAPQRRRSPIERPRPEAKRVWASLAAEPEEVINAAFREAARRDPTGAKTWVVLCDGSNLQLRDICRAEYTAGARVEIILDLIHVSEHLWEAATAFHPPSSPEAEAWVHERLLAILRGRAAIVAAGMRRSATLRGLSAERRRFVDKCAGYLLGHLHFLRYDEYLARGLPIATGVIEGACRHLVKDRMDLTGASWRLTRGEAVLRLRSLRASGDFEEYWEFHERREYERNYAAKYAGRVPRVLRPSPTRSGGRTHLRLVP